MEIIDIHFENDILQSIPDEQLMIYYEFCKAKLPSSIRGQFFLKIQHRWLTFLKRPENETLRKTISSKCIYNFFTHRNGNPRNCTFIAISDEGFNGQDYSIFAFTMEDDNSELSECFHQTKRIKWNLSPIFLSMQTEHLPIVKEIIEERNLEIQFEKPNVAVRLPKEKAKLLEYTVPDHIYLDQLKPEDTDIIEPLWPHRSPGADNFIRSTIILNGGLGVYDKKTNKLLSWVLKNENYAPGSLQTIDSERGKGYGKLVLKAYCKKFAEEEEHDIIAFIVCINTVSRNLFSSLGFEEYGGVSYLRLKRF